MGDDFTEDQRHEQLVAVIVSLADQALKVRTFGPESCASNVIDWTCSGVRQLSKGVRIAMETQDRKFTTLGEKQCLELLQGHHVGRIGWQAGDGPQILPVTYAWHDGAVVFRTSPYGVLSDLIRPTDVAMEIDDLDQTRHSGWSVMVQGRAEAVAEPADMVSLWTVDGLVPWAPGVRNVFIRLSPRRITGRRLLSRATEDDHHIRPR